MTQARDRYRVYLYEAISERSMAYLAEHTDVRVLESPYAKDLAVRLADADAIIIRAKGSVSEQIIDSAKRLKVIGRHGTGVNNIDVEAAKRRQVRVVNTPAANSVSVADRKSTVKEHYWSR